MSIVFVDKKFFVVSEALGVAVYDFDFDLYFPCSHPYQIDHEALCILRTGPIENYVEEFDTKLAMGLRLVNTPQEHVLASELESWYPIIRDLTPRYTVFEKLPPAEAIESEFGWPVFIKGSRQTSRHNPELSIARSREQYEKIAEIYKRDEILHWQKPVVREFVQLAGVAGHIPGKVSPSVEYRSFWWNGECVGWGRYWYQVSTYEAIDVLAGLELAQEAARRVGVPFLVIDFAKTVSGSWIVIECNDAQESGYAGVPPQLLWRKILDIF